MIPDPASTGAEPGAVDPDGMEDRVATAPRPRAPAISGRQAMLAVALVFLVGLLIGIGIGAGL